MPLVTLKEALHDAEKKGIAIGAFNIANYESCQAVLDAAKEQDCPVIVQIFRRLFESEKARDLSFLIKEMAAHTDISVVLHLDHGNTIRQVEQAIAYGFTSVMIDGSELPFDENIELTKKAVALAHDARLSVEAELGHVQSSDNNKKSDFYTVPEEAAEFVKQTSVDALAVAIGTAHGHYLQTPQLDLERLQKIRSLVNIPLVLHGGSDTPIQDIRKAISYGIRKVNIATEFHQIYMDELRVQSELNKEKFLPIDIFMQPVYEKMKQLIKEKMKQFNLN